MPYTPNTTWVDGSGGGTPLTAARLNNMEAGIWPATQSYTPTWTSTGVAPALVNGTLIGSYIQQGKVVQGAVVLTMGAATTFGTGLYIFSLPVAPAAGVNAPVGMAQIQDASTGAVYLNFAVVGGGGAILASTADAPTINVTNIAPITFAVSDIINLNLSYIAA